MVTYPPGFVIADLSDSAWAGITQGDEGILRLLSAGHDLHMVLDSSQVALGRSWIAQGVGWFSGCSQLVRVCADCWIARIY
jgi:hypothetical protein